MKTLTPLTHFLPHPWHTLSTQIEDWLVSKLPAGAAVGFDPWVHTVSGSEKLRGVLEREGLRLVPLASNPVDEVWGAARPAAPSGAVRLHALEWAGKAATEKLAELRAEMAKRGASALLVTALDEVAWLLNIRGADVDHNPVVLAYVLVEKEAATLFVDELKVGPEAAAALAAAGVALAPYERVRSALARAATEAVAAGTRVWLDPGKVNAALRETAASAALTDADAPAPKRARGEASGAEANARPAAPSCTRFSSKPRRPWRWPRPSKTRPSWPACARLTCATRWRWSAFCGGWRPSSWSTAAPSPRSRSTST